MKINKENILAILSEENTYTTPRESYSPFASNVGLIVDPQSSGVDALWLHYNRFSRPLWQKLIGFPAPFDPERSTVDKLVFGEAQAALAFYDTDCFLFTAKDAEEIPLFRQPAEALGEHWLCQCGNALLLRGYSRNGDGRDPDEAVCFLAGVKPLAGTLRAEDGTITATGDENGSLLLAFAFQFLTLSQEALMELLNAAPDAIDKAAALCAAHLTGCVSGLSLNAETPTERKMLAKALHGLLFNLTKAPGALAGRYSSFPNRGEYPTHFLWDTCFQNLAYELASEALVKDFLLQFSANQRGDGKYPQFLCSTWARPGETQPALIGWATLRFTKKCKDKSFLRTMLSSLERNNEWWLSARMTSRGLVTCPHGLETGQDDSPRFDNGPTLATDMNSYLLNQLRCTAELAQLMGESETAARWDERADALSEAILSVLYCEEDNLFYDADPKTGAFIKIVSPVSLLPLWAGVRQPENKARDMIERYLLNPDQLFGDVPFPSVAYDQTSYQPSLWWRGPTWLPEAWLMLETLERFGYKKERDAARRRLYDMLLRDVSMHELFDSRTGQGLGSEEQGWTCAIFIKLCKIING